MWENVRDLFVAYIGDGLIWVILITALIYLFLAEKDRVRRILFLYAPIVLILLFFNPLFIEIIYGILGEQIYYRILWLIPGTVILGYAATKIYAELRGRRKVVFAGVACFITIVSGRLIYINPQYSVADNFYHVPQEVVTICDAIEMDGREVMAVFPIELVQYVRQYSAYICMPYGREMLVPKWQIQHGLHELIVGEVVKADKVSAKAREFNCHYIILDGDNEKNGEFEDYGYEKILSVGKYDVYLDSEADLDI